MSQETLARKIGVTVKTIANLESGRSSVLKKQEHMQMLANEVNMPIDALYKMARVGEAQGKVSRIPIPAELITEVSVRAVAAEVGVADWVSAAIREKLGDAEWKPVVESGVEK